MRSRRALRADGRRRSLRRADGGTARALEPVGSGEDRSHRRRPRRPLRVPPRLPGRRARSRLRLRTLGAPTLRRKRPNRLLPRRDRPRPTGRVRAAVLAVLRVQRFQQPARGRLGDDPARLRRSRRARGDRREPQSIGYSSHEGAERAEWGDEKLEVVEGTHPVVYPAAGSHANKFTEALYLGSSAEAGVGCDDTRGPHVEFSPAVETIPSDPDAARRAFPWIAFEGRWGELQRAFFNGPTGPNLKSQWTEPIGWSEDWRPRSYAVPTGGVARHGRDRLLLHRGRDGLEGLVALLRNPAADAARCSPRSWPSPSSR